MKEEKKLKKIIEKAIVNRFKFSKFLNEKVETMIGTRIGLAKDAKEQWRILVSYKELILFNHDFAKAFWKKEVKTPQDLCFEGGKGGQEYWQFYLTKAVLEEDVIEYYYKFI